MGDGNFWYLGGVTRWNSQFLIHTWTFLAIMFCYFTIVPLFDLDKSTAQIGVYNNTLASKICVKLLKPPNIQIPTPNTCLSDLLTHHDFTPCSLHSHIGYQFPYTVTNRCFPTLQTWGEAPTCPALPCVLSKYCSLVTWGLGLPQKLLGWAVWAVSELFTGPAGGQRRGGASIE
jgi:hypothetical protein